MARRRSKRGAAKKPKLVEKLDTVFTCPFCSHKNSVACLIDKEVWVGEAGCSICKASYITKIHRLTEPIDIYSEWIDECERVNQRSYVEGRRCSLL